MRVAPSPAVRERVGVRVIAEGSLAAIKGKCFDLATIGGEQAVSRTVSGEPVER